MRSRITTQLVTNPRQNPRIGKGLLSLSTLGWLRDDRFTKDAKLWKRCARRASPSVIPGGTIRYCGEHQEDYKRNLMKSDFPPQQTQNGCARFCRSQDSVSLMTERRLIALESEQIQFSLFGQVWETVSQLPPWHGWLVGKVGSRGFIYSNDAQQRGK